MLERYGQTLLASEEAGCLFVKMRAARSRLGPQTQALVAAMVAHFLAQYTRLFTDAARRGEWRGGIAIELAANYLLEQMDLAVGQHAAGKSPDAVRAFLELALRTHSAASAASCDRRLDHVV